MSASAEKKTILVVDDTPTNITLLLDALKPDYRTKVATNGEKALAVALGEDPPDLILLDIMMPGMNGYEVCARLKAEPVARDIPIVFVTAMNEVEDEEKGLALGGVDYITKPISPPIVRARVQTHLALYEQKRQLARLVAQLEKQAAELAEWNATLEQRVAEEVAKVDRLARLKRFFSPAVAELILAGGVEDPLKSRRREIVVVFLDIRGYTAFSEIADPEDVMRVLAEYHQAMGELIMAHGGTLERFGGDSLMIFFNDPVPMDDPAGEAVSMAIAMQRRMLPLAADWKKRGFDLSMGIGIAQGYATIGAIGFEGRRDYSAIGTVTNLAARLCSEARGGQILVSQRVRTQVGDGARFEALGELKLKGFHQPVPAYSVALDDNG